MWTVIYIASNCLCAQSIKEKLVSEGVLVALRCTGASKLENCETIEILVPESEVEEAHEILATTVFV
jgi:hypothetical protein